MGGKSYTADQKENIYQEYLKNKTLKKTSRNMNIPLATVQRVIQKKVDEKGLLGVQKEKEKVNFEDRITEDVLNKAIWGSEKSLDHILNFLKNHVDDKNLDKNIRTIITVFGVLSDKISKFLEIKKFGRPFHPNDETQMILIERIIQVVEKHVPQETLISVIRELEESAVDSSSMSKKQPTNESS